MAGAGHDTNVLRTAGSPSQGDGLSLFMYRGGFAHHASRFSSSGNLHGGVKLFLHETGYSSVSQTADMSAAWRLGSRFRMGFSLDLKDRKDNDSGQDYLHGGLAGMAVWVPLDHWSFTLRSGPRLFRFKELSRFNNWGEGSSLRVTRSWGTTNLSALVHHGARRFSHPSLVARLDNVGALVVSSAEDANRVDRLTSAALEISHTRSSSSMGGSLFSHTNSSNSLGSSHHRYGARLTLAMVLPLDVYLALWGVLQQTGYRDPVAGLADPSIDLEDDETRSSVVVRATRPLGHGLSLECKMSQYFSLGDAKFRRQILFVGVGYEVFGR